MSSETLEQNFTNATIRTGNGGRNLGGRGGDVGYNNLISDRLQHQYTQNGPREGYVAGRRLPPEQVGAPLNWHFHQHNGTRRSLNLQLFVNSQIQTGNGGDTAGGTVGGHGGDIGCNNIGRIIQQNFSSSTFVTDSGGAGTNGGDIGSRNRGAVVQDFTTRPSWSTVRSAEIGSGKTF